MTVKEIIEAYLREHGYDGIYAPEDECGCHLGDLFPCGGTGEDCIAGYLLPDGMGIGPKVDKGEEQSCGLTTAPR